MGKRTYRTQTWEEWYQNARAYSDTFGNLLVPHDYVTAEGYRLGRWIERQRAMYNGILPSSLDSERCLLLEKIGMVWKLEDRFKWEEWLSRVQEYRQEYGNLDVPTDYTTKSGCQLGFWIKEQRKKYKTGHLTMKQVQELEHYGMIWRFYERKDWGYWFQLAQAYYKKNGNLLVPADYRTASGEKLGSWIFVQRERYCKKHGRKPLSGEQIEALDRLSMVWTLDVVRDEKWHEMLHWIEAYKNHYGRLPLKPAIKAPDGRSMGNWISVQRTALSKGKVSEDRTKRLESLGIFP
ncbi:helicase associated domain-containing protein [Ruminococcus sp. OA3]|uniref:helicase associated domain-containing protein n=1 Tax=Ruminococcus sp. OA3 TaxID=2914164 RepID=UPI001F069C3A|nr:helicase associated domain-containing protein [Ruminococcus sp. OA3]MCH1984073.1 helicase associated domain-containing protein [Ruminococcus sp. OA3]